MRVCGLLVLSLGLTGCISGRPPAVEVAGAEVVEATEEAARVELSLMLRNPNAVALPLPEASYSVAVSGVGSYASVELPARVLPPNGEQSVRLPAVIALETVDDLRGRAWRASGNVTYRPENAVRRFLTESGVPLPVVLFSGEGTLD
ncbi:MAG: hypothetical protein AAF593_16105 [Planctomycetota bacterium]